MSISRIVELKKGETPSLLDTTKGNELIKAINALLNIEIDYGETFEVIYGSNKVSIIIPEPIVTEEEEGKATETEFVELYACVNGQSKKIKFLTQPEAER